MDTIRNDYHLSVPHDVSVIGFDDIPQAAWGAYQLTTIRQCTSALAQAIVRAIRSDDEPLEDRTTTVDVALVERASVRT
jgi:DNA-binding LacI/PurR family transcriptional regulator